MKTSKLEALLLYSKGHYVPFNTREVEGDLGVLFSHLTLVSAEYFTSKRGRDDLIRLLVEAVYELREGKLSKDELLAIVQAPYNWLGDRLIETLVGIFANERMIDGEGNPIRELAEVDPKLAEAIRLGRSLREIRAVSEEQSREHHRQEPSGRSVGRMGDYVCAQPSATYIKT